MTVRYLLRMTANVNVLLQRGRHQEKYFYFLGGCTFLNIIIFVIEDVRDIAFSATISNGSVSILSGQFSPFHIRFSLSVKTLGMKFSSF